MTERIVSLNRWGQLAAILLQKWSQPCGLLLGAVFLFFLNPASMRGQIVGDQTLPSNSAVSTQDGLLYQINQGTTQGTNLFHSFDQFSIPVGGEVRFNNSASVENIISRVTGGSISNIDGLIKAGGNANLFFLNPNGIIFGPNSSLDIGGSFLATTAASLEFSDGSSFSSLEPLVSPLLTINTPVGLQFGENPGAISSQSTTMNPLINRFGFGVSPGQSLLFLGGDLLISGGLFAPGGMIGLVAADSDSSIGVTQLPVRLALDPAVLRNGLSISTNKANLDVSPIGTLLSETIILRGGSIDARGITEIRRSSSIPVSDNEGIVPVIDTPDINIPDPNDLVPLRANSIFLPSMGVLSTVNALSVFEVSYKEFSEAIVSVCVNSTIKESIMSRFFVSGRGGISSDPTDILSQDAVIAGWVGIGHKDLVAAQINPHKGKKTSRKTIPKPQLHFEEAQGWHFTKDGYVALTTQPREDPETVAQISGSFHPSCARDLANGKA